MYLVVPCTQQIISSVRVRWLLLSPMPTWYSDMIVTVKLQKTNYKVLIIIIKCSFKDVDPIFNKPAKIRNFRGINLFVPPLSDQRCPDRSNHQQDQSRSDRSGRSELPHQPQSQMRTGLPYKFNNIGVALPDPQDDSYLARSTRTELPCQPPSQNWSELLYQIY